MNAILFVILASVLLAWDPSPSLDVTHYNLYHAQAPALTSWVKSAPILGLEGRIDGLEAGHTYRFYATASNAVGESVPSDWLEWSPPPRIPFLTWDHQGVYVYGDPDTDYTVETSPDMVTWTPVAVLKGNGSGPVPFTGKTAFFRARGAL